uniref:Eukaryotic translation initiation factor 2D n=1 Tax=Gadus morhua TaxID=8049 RepID=A0A8C4ZMB2_GADMO
MFTKAFRVKSNTVIKGSDRRKLKVDVSTAFPLLSESELSEVVPNKEEINVVKVYAHKGDAITLYVLHKNPLFFELEKRLYPTVYMLWQYPNVLPSFATWAPVIQKIAGGADLMLPGVVVPSCGLPEVRQGECCVVKVVGNEAPMAVGIAAMSTAEMSSAGMKGRDEMDALLLQCFLHALKSKVKKSELPLLTSSFLRNHMFPCCPNGKQLDIKKSSYKKLSKFLQTMQQQHRVVRVKELTKGVESLVEVDWKNPVLRSFRAPAEPHVEEVQMTEDGEKTYHPPEITILYSVSARVEPLFREANKRCVGLLGEVRAIITEYVKANELVDENNKNYVHINPILCDCLLEKSEYHEVSILKWDDLFSRTLSKMQECSQFVIAGQQPIMKKGHIEPIDITVASRGSNKKVTLIKNLEMYGLDPIDVSAALQHRVQASAVLHPVPGTKDKVLVQIQGNQIQQVGNLLLDRYHIPRKYIQGLEKAQKGKKK